MKKDFIDAINYAKYVAFILATICVLVFKFTASSLCISFALSLYIVAFALMCTSMILHSVEVFKEDRLIKHKNKMIADIEVNKEGSMAISELGELNGNVVEPTKLKSEKFWSIVGAVFFGVFAIFTFIVMILY